MGNRHWGRCSNKGPEKPVGNSSALEAVGDPRNTGRSLQEKKAQKDLGHNSACKLRVGLPASVYTSLLPDLRRQSHTCWGR